MTATPPFNLTASQLLALQTCLASPHGQAQMRQSLARVRAVITRLQTARQIDPADLRQPLGPTGTLPLI